MAFRPVVKPKDAAFHNIIPATALISYLFASMKRCVIKRVYNLQLSVTVAMTVRPTSVFVRNYPVTVKGIPADDNNNSQEAGWENCDINPVTLGLTSFFLTPIPNKKLRVDLHVIIQRKG